MCFKDKDKASRGGVEGGKGRNREGGCECPALAVAMVSLHGLVGVIVAKLASDHPAGSTRVLPRYIPPGDTAAPGTVDVPAVCRKPSSQVCSPRQHPLGNKAMGSLVVTLLVVCRRSRGKPQDLFFLSPKCGDSR